MIAVFPIFWYLSLSLTFRPFRGYKEKSYIFIHQSCCHVSILIYNRDTNKYYLSGGNVYKGEFFFLTMYRVRLKSKPFYFAVCNNSKISQSFFLA